MKKILFLLLLLPMSLWSQNITKVEYFIDSDPGVGSGTDVPITAGTPLADLNFSVDMSAVSTGWHQLGVRSKDANDKWSETTLRPFYKGAVVAAAALPIIDQIEYGFDTDNGIGGTGTFQISTPGTPITTLDFTPDASGLSAGFHQLFVRSHDTNGQWSETTTRPFYKAAVVVAAALPVIDKIEYFVDTDPGFGAATNVPVTGTPTDITNFNFDASASTVGFHRLFVRTRDASGRWSETTSRSFYKAEPVVATLLPDITKVEYFINTDPGFGNGIDVPAATTFDLANLTFSPSMGGLSVGFHKIYIRSRDANGRWSETTVKSFYKSAVALQSTAPDITQIEYFLDADPGIGNGVQITPTAAINIQDLNFDIDIHALSIGFHRLFVRAYNQNGAWSLVANKPFLNSPNEVSPLYPITKAEYFFDTDPGFGLGTDIGLASATDIPTLNFSPNVAGLSIGWHTLYTRSRITTMDGTQRWSQTTNRPFYRAAVETASALPNLTRIEYFVDFDPGFGNGTAVSFTAGTTVAALNFDIDASGLSNGHHRLFTRSRDANGRWSETTASIFAVNQPLPLIDRVEYFVDDGSVINVPVTSSVDIANFNFNVNVEALSEGFHKLSIRSRNTKSEWSEVTIKSFYKGVSPLSILPNIDKVEYFVDTDPGFGNGRNVPITAATDITSNNFNVSMGGLTSGLHKLYVRSRDVNGLWSETNVTDFTNNANIAMTVKVFLQGAYDAVSHTMTDNLRNLALIPTTEPYTGLSFTHVNGGGNEQASSTAFNVNGDNSVVDWVFLELRDATNSTIVVATQSALLQKDGDIVAKDGVSTLEWSGVAEGNYYVAVHHRNHLAARTAVTKPFALATTTPVDFTTSLAEILATPSSRPYNAVATMTDGRYALWGGNANSDTRTRRVTTSTNDYLFLLNYLFGADRINSVYRREDFNLDGNVRKNGSTLLNNDYLMLLNILGINDDLLRPTF